MSYLWTVYDGSGNVTASYTGPTAEFTAAQSGYATVTVTDAATGLATTVSLGNPNNVSGLVWSTNPSWLPTLSVTETDTNQTVSEGGVAHFDVHAEWSARSWGTSGMGPWLPVVLPMTVYYDTIDPSGSAPADYQSTYGPQPVTLSVSFDSATDTWIANGTIQVQTTSVISDGGQGSVTVQLIDPFLCQLAGGGGGGIPLVCQADAGSGGSGGGTRATAAVDEPQVQLFLTDAEHSDLNVTNTLPVGMEVGETVTLTAKINGNPVGVGWTSPDASDAIASYDPYGSSSELVPLTLNGEPQPSITFEWVALASSTSAQPLGAGPAATAYFVAQAPDVTVTATPGQLPGYPSVPGTQLWPDPSGVGGARGCIWTGWIPSRVRHPAGNIASPRP